MSCKQTANRGFQTTLSSSAILMILGLEIRYKGRYEPKSFVSGPSSPHIRKLYFKDPQVWSWWSKQSKQWLCVPKCNQTSSRVYSRYEQVADLPWQGVTVQIQLLTRRFFCVNKRCVRRIFCERLPRVVAAYGRQTVRQ